MPVPDTDDAIGDHRFTGLQTALHDPAPLDLAVERDRTGRRHVVGADDIDDGALRALHDGRLRHHDGVGHRDADEVDPHELARQQAALLVGKHRADLHRAGARIDDARAAVDLAVDRVAVAAAELELAP